MPANRPAPARGALSGNLVTAARSSVSLEEVAGQLLSCRACGLRETCRAPVPGEGDPRAGVALVGEAPGAEEDRLGRPFVGPAGKLLDRLLALAGLSRERVYVTNVVKCRPPGNRTPAPEEAGACRAHLLSELALVRPRVLVCLGATAARALLDPGVRVTEARGRWVRRGDALCLPTFHPAALLRDREKLALAALDFKRLGRAVREVRRPLLDVPPRLEQMTFVFPEDGR